MTIVAMCGFEMGSSGRDHTDASGTAIALGPWASYSLAQVRTGTYSILSAPNPSELGAVTIASPGVGTYWNFGLYITTRPSTTRIIFGDVGSGSVNLRLTSTGTIQYIVNTTVLGTSSVISTGAWHWFGVRCLTGTSVDCLVVDGVVEVNASPTVTVACTKIGVNSTEANAISISIDDLIVDNAGFLSPSKVPMLKPISDNARGANWFKADGSTTTNLFQSVDNIPTVGVASASEAATPLASIRHSGGANNAYDANMTTYTSAGIGAADTILAFLAMVRHGEDIATGTKLLAMGLVSNPNIGVGSNFSAGNDAGAHLGEVNLWVTKASLHTSFSAPTLGTSPVLRISRPETASRVACVDSMTCYVAYTPAVAANLSDPTRLQVYPQLLAH